jgi:hypothetical protein
MPQQMYIKASCKKEIVRRVFNRKLAHHIEVWDVHIDVENGKLETVEHIAHCCEHNISVKYSNLGTAIYDASSPWIWCKECNDLKKELYPDETIECT